ncbi:MAG: hypothetical protein ACREH3_18500 [Geminicoccales bacterium]
MSGVEIALLAVSTAIAAAGTVMQASNQAKMSRYNAQVAEQNAAAAQRQAEADAARQQRQVERNLAKRRTAFASGGVSIEGSPLDLLEDLAMEGQLDVLGVRRRGLSEARQFSVSAARSRFQAGSALQQGSLGAGQQITAGGASLAPKVKKHFNLP